MKKKIAIILALSGMLLSGCASDDIGIIGGADGPTAVIVADGTEAPLSEDGISEEALRTLFDENLYCMRDVFVLFSLDFEEEPTKDGHIHRVTDEKFRSYDAFESYVRSVYCEKTADMLLYDFPYEGNPRYLNIGGELYIDSYLVGGKGYYVDWTDYTIQITSCDENRCEFTVTGIFTEPSENPVGEPYTTTGAAIKENGKWVLEEMMH